jgi:hypothetical protein
MKFKIIALVIIAGCCFSNSVKAQCFDCSQAPVGTIFCDDFESSVPLTQKYFEYVNPGNSFVLMDSVGRDSSSGMRVRFQQGQVSAGNLKKSFGRTPNSYIGNHASSPTQDFDDIYWRMDVRLQPGWIGGGGDKLSRVTCLANANWAQGAIAHLWSGGSSSNYLVMDPASGIDVSGNLVSTTYNDFPNLRWLGAQAGTIDLFSTVNSGRWFCVEGHIKLNTPALSDGIFEFWINDTLQASATNLNWHGDWNLNPNNYKINVIMFENYWNSGSPVMQERYFDNLVISTQRIGCCVNPASVHQNYMKEKDAVKVFPNPAHSTFAISFSKELTIQNGSTGSPTAELKIYDVTGREVHEQKLNQPSTIINQQFSPGVYFVKVRAGERVYTEKLVVE